MSFLPFVSKLQSYSACLSVKAGTLHMRHLKQRADQLEEKERLMTLMIDEVYTAKYIEHSNETFVEVTKEG